MGLYDVGPSPTLAFRRRGPIRRYEAGYISHWDDGCGRLLLQVEHTLPGIDGITVALGHI